MVKNRLQTLMIASLLATVITGCGVFRWGETPPPAKVATLDQGGTGGYAPLLIVNGTESESLAALEYWNSQVSDVWKSIHGRRSDELTETEIANLIRNRILDLPGDPEVWTTRIISIKRLLGFPDAVTKDSVQKWMNWLREYRPLIRRFTPIFLSDKPFQWKFSDIRNLVRLSAALFKRGVAPVSANDLANLMQPLLPESSPHLRAGIAPLVRIGVNITMSFCGPGYKESVWDGQRVGDCLDRAIDHFNQLEPYIDFLLGNRSISNKADLASLFASANRLGPLAHEWFDSSDRVSINMNLWYDLGDSMGFKDSQSAVMNILRWLPKFSPHSTAEKIHPEVISLLADAYQEADVGVLSSADAFAACPGYWLDCRLDLETLKSLKNKGNPSIKTVWHIRNPYFAQDTLPMSGSNFRYILLLHAFAGKIIPVFDRDNDQTVEVSQRDSSNEVLAMLAAGMQFADTQTFFLNIWNALNEKPVSSLGAADVLKPFRLPGVTELLALVADVLPDRSDDRHLLDNGLFGSLLGHKQAMKIDKIGLASIIWTIYSVGELEESFLKQGLKVRTTEDGSRFVDRRSIVASLPSMISKTFPRINKACVDGGYSKTCGVVFTQLLPNPVDGTNGENNDYDLDILSISALFMEGLIEKCDRDGNGSLKSEILIGDDELDCAFRTVKTVVDRLMDSTIMDNNRFARGMLKVINATSLTRVVGKAAMSRGTLHGIVFTGTVLSPFYQKATLSSLLHLTAELMNEDALKMLEKGLKPADNEVFISSQELWPPKNEKVRAPGDELIFNDDWAAAVR